MKRPAIAVLSVCLLICVLTTLANSWTVNPFTSRGPGVFSRGVVLRFGGVVLTGVAEVLGEDNEPIPPGRLSLALHHHGGLDPQICVVLKPPFYRFFEKKHCYRLNLPPDVGLALASWVLANLTGAFSLWDPSEQYVAGDVVQYFDSEDFDAEEDRNISPTFEYVSYDYNEGYVPSQLATDSVARLLMFIDFDSCVQSVLGDEMKNRSNSQFPAYLDVTSLPIEASSYINTDIDTKYIVSLHNGDVLMSGYLYRYHWILYEGMDFAYISNIERFCNPDSMPLSYINDADASLRYGAVDSVDIQNQREGLELAQTAAFFRRLRDDNPSAIRNLLRQAWSQ